MKKTLRTEKVYNQKDLVYRHMRISRCIICIIGGLGKVQLFKVHSVINIIRHIEIRHSREAMLPSAAWSIIARFLPDAVILPSLEDENNLKPQNTAGVIRL